MTKNMISVIKKGDYKIHTYTSTEDGLFVNTHILETPKELVIVDAQFSRSDAQKMRKYAKSLKKPIERIIITHSHPDHWFGLEYFRDIPSYALKETIEEINKTGMAAIQLEKSSFGNSVTDTVYIPGYVIFEGKEIIDGLEMEFKKIENAEDATHLLIIVRQLEAAIAQDLVFGGAHLFIGRKKFSSWKKALSRLKNLNMRHILVGHGKNGGGELVDRNIEYLSDAESFFRKAENGEELKSMLIEKYPDFMAPAILDISNLFLYPRKEGR